VCTVPFHITLSHGNEDMAIRGFFDSTDGHSRDDGHEVAPIHSVKPLVSSHPQYTVAADVKAVGRAVARVIQSREREIEVVQCGAGNTQESDFAPDPQIAVWRRRQRVHGAYR
jgi:hypothetical protein